MRKDEFSRAEQRWSRRDIFGERRRRRIPWGVVMMVLVAIALALIVSSAGMDSFLGSLESWLPTSSESPQIPEDPNSLPLLPLPPPS